jgi:pyruvate,water dikinase
MSPYIAFLDEPASTSFASVGGKGANLGELLRAGFAIPEGFCVTTAAYRAFVGTSPELSRLLDELAGAHRQEAGATAALAERIRSHLATLSVPTDIESAVLAAWRRLGTESAYAVRSSATAEDLPAASFAGQQDTFLNVKGERPLLSALKACWASLFTSRAVAYRSEHGFDHRDALLAVVVQRMVFPECSGVLFTVDPVSGRRGTVCIDASFGLGEALVSGQVTPDLYQVRAGAIVSKRIAQKTRATWPNNEGGTRTEDLPTERQAMPALLDEQILQLAELGLRIRAHYGSEQDIEWCYAQGEFLIVQSRPITSLYPAPRSIDGKLHLFASFGHPQMMTEAMKPLGISVVRSVIPIGDRSSAGESEFAQPAGSRIYIDLNQILRYRLPKRVVPHALPLADEKIARAVAEFCKRSEYQAALLPEKRFPLKVVASLCRFLLSVARVFLSPRAGPSHDDIDRAMAAKVAARRRTLEASSGPETIARVRLVLRGFFPDLFAIKVVQNVAPGVLAFRLIERWSKAWLGDAAELAALARSPRGNVTTEMGLALGDLADFVRAHPGAMERVKRAIDGNRQPRLQGGNADDEVLFAFRAFLDRYGMRGTGEIDMTRPRWREVPSQLVPAIEGHLRASAPGEHRRQFEAGAAAAERAENELLRRLRATRLGSIKAMIMRRLIAVYRSRIGFREHPKFYLVQMLDLVKQAVLREGLALAGQGLLDSADELFWFTLEEIRESVESRRVDRGLIDARKAQFERDARLRPPRVMTSEGEVITGADNRSVPPHALAGTAASAGTAEGRACVVLTLEGSKLEKGEILVAPYTDPAWTPLFPLAAGVVTEVGGLMTHGAVVAREYGIPAVVGVDRATEAIPNGALIRVNGTEGYVEVLQHSGTVDA